jgi:hypothetical protein
VRIHGKELPLLERRASFRELLGTDGERYSLSSFEEPILLIAFAGNTALEPWFIEFHQTYAPKGVAVVWINSNNAALSSVDSYEEMVKRSKSSNLPFPYLKDETREVARFFGAASTPHVFVLDKERNIRYSGRVADSRQAASIKEPYAQDAIEDLLAGRDISLAETEPYGCSIVW